MIKIKVFSNLIAILALCGCSTLENRDLATPQDKIVALKPLEVTYELEPKISKAPYLKVELSFIGSQQGVTEIAYTHGFPFCNADLHKKISEIEVVQPNTAFQRSPDPNLVKISHPPHAKVTLRYRLEMDGTKDFERNRPLLNSEYFHFFGCALAHPNMPHNQKLDVHLRWQNLPKQWRVANSYGVDLEEQNFSTEAAQLHESLFVGGKIRTHKILIEDKPVYLTTRGKWVFSDQDIVRTAEKVIRSQRNFWNDYEVPYFFIALMPNGQPCCKFGGSSLTNSFVAYLSEKDYNTKRFAYLLSHENFHYWNGFKILPESEGPQYWFTEGFTEYYSRLLNLRNGLTSLEEFIDDYNSLLYKYFSLPTKNAMNTQVAKEFFSNKDMYRIPYIRGAVLAADWNLAIRRRHEDRLSLDDFMLEFFSVLQTKGRKISSQTVTETMRKYLGDEVSRDLHRYIESGQDLEPNPEALGACVKLQMDEVGIYDTGFAETEDNATSIVSDLRGDTNAYRAGLRNGQVILEKRLERWKPWKRIEFKVKDQKGVRWIRYFPQSQTKIRLPQYHLIPGKSPSTCTNWFRPAKP